MVMYHFIYAGRCSSQETQTNKTSKGGATGDQASSGVTELLKFIVILGLSVDHTYDHLCWTNYIRKNGPFYLQQNTGIMP